MFPLTLAVFFASGFAALLYQVIWQRLLGIFSGADVYSATVIVAAFMGGLGIGHLVGGHVADRVSRRVSLVLFATAELAIASFGLFSASFYYGFLYERLGPLDLSREVIGVVLFASLLWPTFFMGASLPLLARAITDRIEKAARIIGALYGFNTLGAAAGALVSTWVLLPSMGLEGSLQIGAMVNVCCALALLPLLRNGVGGHLKTTPSSTPVHVSSLNDLRPHFWIAIYGVAGFVALSYEIVWFRLLGVMVKSTAFTFGTLLAIYLTGLGIGAVAGSALARRVRRPAAVFFGLLAASGLSAALLVAAFVTASDDIRALRGYFGDYEPLNIRENIHMLRTGSGTPANFLRLYVVVPLVLVLPPTVLMGCAFPVLQRVVQTDLSFVGRRVGTLLLANVVGSIVGTVTTGWVLLSLLGTAATLKLLAGVSGVFLFLALEQRAGRPRAAAAAATLTLLAVLAVPRADGLWPPLHGTTADRIVFAEDNTGLSAIRAERPDFQGTKNVFVNGMGQSVLPYGEIHTVLGALPALLHSNPRDVAIVGLGSGDTVYGASPRSETVRIVCVEIIGSQLSTLRAVADRDSYGGLQALLHDPRVEHVVGDGRAYLMRTTDRFDIIEADALRPTSAYSGNLYSDEYFTLVKNRLKPGGLAATWVPTARIRSTFLKVFPYTVQVPGILIGSSQPFEINPDVVLARAADMRVRSHYQRAGIDIVALLRPYVEPAPQPIGPEFDRSTLTDVNTDLFPRDEFDLTPPEGAAEARK